MTDDPFRILVVCTGNVCRSPVAAAVLRDALAEIAPGDFVVDSAGTRALVGEPAQPESAAIATRFGSTLEGFTARQLTEPMVARADLVLILAERHRASILRLHPALKRTFTLREFARLVATLPVDPSEHALAQDGEPRGAWRHLVARAWEAKSADSPASEGENDVVDPYRLGPEVWSQMTDELVPALEVIFGRADLVARG
ncbi:low molecular weight phosphatase family protein [Sinomonas sp. P10A9]|uniref:Low molecular weight phosphatase family protein n=1 Tax=Sinomonas puerhi TaxID=3238584 RepID=A0AB39L2P8_9MICC